MEIIVSLSQINNLEKVINNNVDGIAYGSLFSLDYDYTLEEFIKLSRILDQKGIKKYCVIDQIISETDKSALYQYLEIVSRLKFDGIYFHDLSIYEIGVDYGLKDKLIYDGSCILANSLDSTFILSKGIKGAVIARELTLDEYKKILKNNHGMLDMQIFGRFKMSYSKRKFLSDYFKEINKNFNPKGNNNLTIEEELRNYKMPIRQNDFGTVIYTDYVFEMYEELIELMPYISRAIISDTLLDCNVIIDVIKDLRRIDNNNASFLKETLIRNYPHIEFNKGYLYTPTNKEKIDE